MLTQKELTAWIQDLKTTPAKKQGKNYLYTREGTFCCLGRLCEVKGAKRVTDGFRVNGRFRAYDVPKTWIPDDAQTVLTSLNDQHSWSFKRIAKMLEVVSLKSLAKLGKANGDYPAELAKLIRRTK